MKEFNETVKHMAVVYRKQRKVAILQPVVL